MPVYIQTICLFAYIHISMIKHKVFYSINTPYSHILRFKVSGPNINLLKQKVTNCFFLINFHWTVVDFRLILKLKNC